jgi:hypothetical protein
MESNMQNLYESPPMRIGKHFWRIVITPQGYTEYQFRKPPTRLSDFTVMDTTWHRHREWPGYDFDDGIYAGLPKSIQRLWEANRVEIERILHGKEPAQGELFEPNS